jgi:GNAT superfamily N-acetyltransferase
VGDGDLTIRAAVRADIPAIVALYADDVLGAARETPHDLGRYEAAFDRILATGGVTQVLIAERDGAIIGTMQMTVLPGLSHCGSDRAQLEAVRVAAAGRGGGIGTIMVQWAIAEARRRGCRMIELTSNRQRVDAARFYERLGFVPSHTGFKMTL